MGITYIFTPSYDAFLEDSRERSESTARKARIVELETEQDELVSNAQSMSFEEFEEKLDKLRKEQDELLDEEYPDRDKESVLREIRIVKLEKQLEDTLANFEFGCAEAQAEHDSIRAELDALCPDDEDEDLEDLPF